MKDKQGLDYKELCAFQLAQLQGIWSDRLKDDLYDAVSDYVILHRREAQDDKHNHQVFRGQDLVQIIMDWPELKPCYPSPVATEDVI